MVSIFVNPAQFGPNEDLDTYPSDLEQDQARLKGLGVDAVFLPQKSEIYPEDFKTYINVDDITQKLCGLSRPAYFQGMTTVVLKLLNIVHPQFAYFGEKDWQQLQVVKTLVRDLNLDVTIRGIPIMRDPDGLAMSSRNSYLSLTERDSALSLNQSMNTARKMVSDGESSIEKIRTKIKETIEQKAHTQVEYISICDPYDFSEKKEVRGKALIALAVRVGKTRLIDNCIIERA